MDQPRVELSVLFVSDRALLLYIGTFLPRGTKTACEQRQIEATPEHAKQLQAFH